MSKRRLAPALVTALLAAGLLSGCSIRPDHELEGLVKEVAPGAPADCRWGSSSFDGEPDTWVGCVTSKHGALAPVAASLVTRLTARGFTVRRVDRPHVVQLTARRRGRALCVDALEQGFTRGRNTAAADVDIDAGEVLLDAWATKPFTASARCAALPPFEA